MKTQLIILFLTLTAGGALPARAEQSATSIYTELAEDKCKVIVSDEESGSTVHECPGIAGYKLNVLTDDARQSITVIAPDKKEYPLNYWDVVTRHFSSIGDKAEWRMIKKGKQTIPAALIVRLKYQENSEPPQWKSVLTVAKITPTEICVTDKILASPKQNELARTAADSASQRACLESHE